MEFVVKFGTELQRRVISMLCRSNQINSFDDQSRLVSIYLSIHPFSSVYCGLGCVGNRISRIFNFLGHPQAFPGQMGYFIPSSALNHLPVGHARKTSREVSLGQPHQMAEPPQTGSVRHRATLVLSSSCMWVRHPAKGACVGHLYPWLRHLTHNHRWELQCWNVDRWLVQWECHLQTPLLLRHLSSITPASPWTSRQSCLWISCSCEQDPKTLELPTERRESAIFLQSYHGHGAMKLAEVRHQQKAEMHCWSHQTRHSPPLSYTLTFYENHNKKWWQAAALVESKTHWPTEHTCLSDNPQHPIFPKYSQQGCDHKPSPGLPGTGRLDGQNPTIGLR